MLFRSASESVLAEGKHRATCECRSPREALPTELEEKSPRTEAEDFREKLGLPQKQRGNRSCMVNPAYFPGAAMRLFVRSRNLRSTGLNATKATQVNTSLGSKNCVRRFAPKNNARNASSTWGSPGVDVGSERGWNKVSSSGRVVSGLVKPPDVGARVCSNNRKNGTWPMTDPQPSEAHRQIGRAHV